MTTRYLVLADFTPPGHVLTAGDVITDAQPIVALQKAGLAVLPYVSAMDPVIAAYRAQRGGGLDNGSLAALLLNAYTPTAPGNWSGPPTSITDALDRLAAALFSGPAVTSVAPSGGTPLGGDAVTIYGSGFKAGATVKIGGSSCTSVVVVDAGTITVVTPSGTTGAADVEVTNTYGPKATLANGFTYAAAPTFTSITPSSGTHLGATPVTIVGTGFVAGTTVTVGGVALTSLSIVDSAHITGLTGAHAAAAVDVVVSNVNGTDTGAAAYTYT